MNEKRGITNRLVGVVTVGYAFATGAFVVAVYLAAPLSNTVVIAFSVISLVFAGLWVAPFVVSRRERQTSDGADATNPP